MANLGQVMLKIRERNNLTDPRFDTKKAQKKLRSYVESINTEGEESSGDKCVSLLN